MFTKIAHYTPCFIVFIMQNLFQKGRHARTRSLNGHYLVLFKNPQDHMQVDLLGRQMYPQNSKFLTSAYEVNKAFSNLCIELNHKEMRVRSNILLH